MSVRDPSHGARTQRWLKTARRTGFTLLEVLMAIVILSFGATVFLNAFRDLLPRGPSTANIGIASQLAQERLTLVLAQRVRRGYAGMSDPCGSSVLCNSVSGFTVTLSGLSVSTSWGLDTDTQRYRVITATVTHASGTLAQESVIVANY